MEKRDKEEGPRREKEKGGGGLARGLLGFGVAEVDERARQRLEESGEER